MSLSFPDRRQILVVGVPRSGNTYVARLLGSLLNAPVTGAYAAHPLAEEGLNRSGDYVVRQLHLKPYTTCPDATTAVASGWSFCTDLWSTERIVHILRDPRDVAVSSHFYWQRTDLADTITRLAKGLHPLSAAGGWSSYVKAWFSIDHPHLVHVRYEDLLHTPYVTLHTVLLDLDLPLYTPAQIRSALDEQEISHKRAQIQRDGQTRPYGKAIQLRHLRKGISGDWRNHFDRDCCNLAFDYWHADLIRYGYEFTDFWRDTEGACS